MVGGGCILCLCCFGVGFFFFFCSSIWWAFNVPNHIQVVSKSAIFCVESTDPGQKPKQTEQRCTVLKSWSFQNRLKNLLAWGIQRCLQDGVHSSLASRSAHICYVLPTFCPSPSSLGPETIKVVLGQRKYLVSCLAIRDSSQVAYISLRFRCSMRDENCRIPPLPHCIWPSLD